MPRELFRREAIEYQQDRLFGEALIVSPIPLTIISCAAALITALFITFITVGEYTRKVRVIGYLASDKGYGNVFARETGVILEKRVQEGAHVHVGEVLYVLSLDSGTLANRDVWQSAVETLKRRGEALLFEKQKSLELSHQEKLQTQTQVEDLTAEHAKLLKTIALQKQRVETFHNTSIQMKSLLESHFISQNKYQESLGDQLEQEVQLEELSRTQLELERQINSTKAKLPEIELRLAGNISTIERSIQALDQERREADGKRELVVESRIEGTATAVQGNIGDVITPRVSLLSVVPDNSKLEAHLLVPANAIGFIEAGKKISLRYAAYPYTQFGHYGGEVRNVSKSITQPNELYGPIRSTEPVYLVDAVLDRQTVKAYGKEIHLQPGMALEADVYLDRHHIYQWIFEPLIRLTGKV